MFHGAVGFAQKGNRKVYYFVLLLFAFVGSSGSCLPVKASNRDFMDKDNSEDFRRTAGGSFSSEGARAGEPYGRTGADVFLLRTGMPSP